MMHRFFARLGRPIGVALVAVMAAVFTSACGAQGTQLRVDPDSPLKSLRVGVMAHPEKLDSPEQDENVQFARYLESLGDTNPFAGVEIVHDTTQSSADIFISLNMDVNYVTQVSREVHFWKLITLYMYAVFGLPTYISSANYHISAVLYDKNGEMVHAFWVNEPVTFQWDNQYWAPEPNDPKVWRLPFNRLLNLMDRDMRRLQEGKPILGGFGSTARRTAPLANVGSNPENPQ